MLAKSDWCALGHCKRGAFACCSASLFLLDSVIKYKWARRARETLIWYLDGGGENINVRLPRAKLMPPRERFYVATTGPRAPHNAPAPYKANESRRVHGGRRSRQTGARNYRDTRAQATFIMYVNLNLLYPLFALQNARTISIKPPLNLFSFTECKSHNAYRGNISYEIWRKQKFYINMWYIGW